MVTRLRITPVPVRRGAMAMVIGPVLIGAAVTVILGVYGRLHEPTFFAVVPPGFSGPMTVKVWLATAAAVFAVVQVASATVMYGRVPIGNTAWAGPVHRWSGRIAFLLTVPVATHCLYALGFQVTDTRIMAHSALGCLFYGAFTTKMLVLTRPGRAGWIMSIVGGLVFTALIGIVLTSALWYFSTSGVRI
jgi:hypothetical protein